MKPELAPSSERQAALTVQRWLERTTSDDPEQKVPILPLKGRNAITEEEYLKFRNIMRSTGFPIPVGLMLNNQAIMWTEDERGLPQSVQQAIAILEYFHLTNQGRLPV